VGNEDKHPNNYVFPILETGQTPLRQFDLVQLFVRFINDWMYKIAKNLGIDKKATTIVSRHSFSTVMKRSGASTEFIQEALGHMDKKTTENYMDSLEMEVKKEFANRLLAFKNPQPDKKQDKKLNTAQVKINECEGNLNRNNPKVQRLMKALQDFFY